LRKEEIEKQINTLERKRKTLVRKGSWMAVYILDASLEVLKDKLKGDENDIKR
jgi:hypothetical protein